MLSVVRWCAFAGFAIATLPYSVQNAWGYRLGVLFVMIAMITSFFYGIQFERDRVEGNE